MPREQKPYELLCYKPSTQGGGFLEGFASRTTGVSRTVTRVGGYWESTFDIPLDDDNDLDYLTSVWFDSRLFNRIQMRVGGAEVWDGFVWDMTLGHPSGVRRRRSYNYIYNAIRADYLDGDSAPQSTAWFTDDNSVNLYGRRELVQYLGPSTLGEAEAAAESLLAFYKTPWPRLMTVAKNVTPGLSVKAVGWSWTANNKFVGATTLDDTETGVSDLIEDIITNDCAFIDIADVQSNTLPVTRDSRQQYRAWDLIERLVRSGDATLNPWEAFINEGGFTYQQASNVPTMHWYEGKGLTTPAQEHGPSVYWSMWPGVLRVQSTGPADEAPGAGLLDVRDSWIVEIEMSDDLEQPLPKSEYYEPEELLAHQRGLLNRRNESGANGSGVDVDALLEEAGEILGGPFSG